MCFSGEASWHCGDIRQGDEKATNAHAFMVQVTNSFHIAYSITSSLMFHSTQRPVCWGPYCLLDWHAINIIINDGGLSNITFTVCCICCTWLKIKKMYNIKQELKKTFRTKTPHQQRLNISKEEQEQNKYYSSAEAKQSRNKQVTINRQLLTVVNIMYIHMHKLWQKEKKKIRLHIIDVKLLKSCCYHNCDFHTDKVLFQICCCLM